MPIPNVSFWCEVILIPTTPSKLWLLIQNTFIANGRSTDVIDSAGATFQVAAYSGNAGTVYIGDHTMNIASSPMRGVGSEVLAGQGVFNPSQGGSGNTNDIGTWWVQSSVGVNYLLIRFNQSI